VSLFCKPKLRGASAQHGSGSSRLLLFLSCVSHLPSRSFPPAHFPFVSSTLAAEPLSLSAFLLSFIHLQPLLRPPRRQQLRMAEPKRKSSLTYNAMKAVRGYLKSNVPVAAENHSTAPPMQQVYPQQVFRPTFNLPEIIAPPRPPYSRPGTGHKSVQSFGLQSNASTRYSAGSLGGRSLIAGSFRTQDEIQELSSEMMAEFLYKQQRLKQWATSMPEEGIMLKRSKGEYACCPESLGYVRGGFYDQVMEMNVRVGFVPFSPRNSLPSLR
jgi:hypothetical protein